MELFVRILQGHNQILISQTLKQKIKLCTKYLN